MLRLRLPGLFDILPYLPLYALLFWFGVIIVESDQGASAELMMKFARA